MRDEEVDAVLADPGWVVYLTTQFALSPVVSTSHQKQTPHMAGSFQPARAPIQAKVSTFLPKWGGLLFNVREAD